MYDVTISASALCVGTRQWRPVGSKSWANPILHLIAKDYSRAVMAYQYQKLADGDIRLLILRPGRCEDPIIICIVHSQLSPRPSNPFTSR